jgi:hypothetical protein
MFSLTRFTLNFRALQLTRQTVAIAILLLFGGCISPSPSSVRYFGTVERVLERQGEFISPIKGYRPLYSIYVQVADPAKADNRNSLEILLLNFYSPEIYGKAGDRIQFRYPGNLPSRRQLDFDSLVEYFIIPSRG